MAGFKNAPAFQPCIIEQNRGSSGEGIWIINLKRANKLKSLLACLYIHCHCTWRACWSGHGSFETTMWGLPCSLPPPTPGVIGSRFCRAGSVCPASPGSG